MSHFQAIENMFLEGDYYAATYLYPREMAGLQADVANLAEEMKMRFRYYEGTHGVQLKGCCGSDESCPFSSDKFVSVSDRNWKFGSFACPKGTDKVKMRPRRLVFWLKNEPGRSGDASLIRVFLY